MLPSVNSEYNCVMRNNFSSCTKLKDLTPSREYNIIERERRKTIEEDRTITAFPRRDPKPQEDETPSSLSLYLVGPISLYRPRSMHRALGLFVSVKKEASLAPDLVFSGESNLKGNLCVRKNDRDYR